ncbi:MAG: hypothetical protein LUO91_08305 [Methanomicrobiales archaeon]|nr:hypothetical protein [Methanomicrobiales archaeon]
MFPKTMVLLVLAVLLLGCMSPVAAVTNTATGDTVAGASNTADAHAAVTAGASSLE